MPTASEPETQAAGRAGNGTVLTVVLAYATFAGLWILLSDKTVEWLFGDPASIALASTVKGWLFVIVTSLLLYGLLRRVTGTMPAVAAPSPPRSILPLALPIIVVLALTAGGIAHTFTSQRDKEVSRLQAIADLKARQISDWLAERRGDAEFAQSSQFFADNYRRWREAGELAAGGKLKARLEQLRQNRGFAAVSLLDGQGELLWGSTQAPLDVAPLLRETARQAAADLQVRRAGPYSGPRGAPRLDFIAPLTAAGERAPLIVLHTDPSDWLYRTLQTWPVPSVSGETLLFRRDGDRIQFLNELRHRKNTAVEFRVPLARENLLAAQVLSGRIESGSMVAGEDYRGVPSLGVAQAIPGTDWFLIAKLDRAELYADARRDAAWIALSGLLALFMAAAGYYLLRQNQLLSIAAGVQQSQAERLHALRLLAAIADNSDDAIFAKDLDGRYILFNRAAGNFVGKPAEAVLGCDDRAIFPAEQAERLMDTGRRAIAENRAITREESLDTPHGEKTFLTTMGPLRDEEGKSIGIFGISRDVTEKKQAEERLRASEERLQLALDATSDGLWDWDFRSGLAYLAPRYYEMTGFSPGEAKPDLEFFKRTVHPDDLPQVQESMTAHLLGKTQASEFDYRVCTPTGQIRWMRARGRIVERDADGTPLRMVGTITDIGARKAAEDALRRQTEELARRNDELERFNRATVGRELDMIALKQQVNALSRQLGREPPYALRFLDEPAKQADGSAPR